MNDWVAQYLKIAKVVLRSKKQSLEKISVTARMTKTAAQRAAPKSGGYSRRKKDGLTARWRNRQLRTSQPA
ncbi:MAG: hypothetical protein H6R36_11 [Chloroflexi bacterium]|nr:hypothetical protein [Chloroflexota bacterium]